MGARAWRKKNDPQGGMGRKGWMEMRALGLLALRIGDMLICLQSEGELDATPATAAFLLVPHGSLKKATRLQ